MLAKILKYRGLPLKSRGILLFMSLSLLFGCLYVDPALGGDADSRTAETCLKAANGHVELNAITNETSVSEHFKLKKSVLSSDHVDQTAAIENNRSIDVIRVSGILYQEENQHALFCLDLPPPQTNTPA